MFNYTYYDILRLENSAATVKIASPNEHCYSGCISGPLRSDEGTGSAISGLNFRAGKAPEMQSRCGFMVSPCASPGRRR